jgi:predicted GIY-YIG superfamily endonuclease
LRRKAARAIVTLKLSERLFVALATKKASEMLIPYFTRKEHLPSFGANVGGIYIIFSGSKILYIGLTWNFRARLNLHNKNAEFIKYKADCIQLVAIKDAFNKKLKLHALERTLIEKHQPTLNQVGTKKYKSGNCA